MFVRIFLIFSCFIVLVIASENDFQKLFHPNNGFSNSYAVSNIRVPSIPKDYNRTEYRTYRIPKFVITLPIVGLLYCFRFCCKKSAKKYNSVQSNDDAPVIVTSTTTTSAPGSYPVTVHHGAPTTMQSTTYTGVQAMPMPQPQMMTNAPYPTHPGVMPQPYGGAQGYAINPPYPSVDPHRVNPPSYDQVVSSEANLKQAPYNPNYMGN